MPAFQWLIDPLPPRQFDREYWETRPLVIQRAAPDYYSDLLSLDVVDEILSCSGIHGPYVRVVHGGRIVNIPPRNGRGVFERANATEELFAELRQGATVVLQSLQEGWPPLRRFCQSLAGEFSAAFQVNVYLTPAGTQGLMPHYDTHDVFVLQIHGTKHWRIFDEAIRLPLQNQVHENQFRDRDDPAQTLDLHPGDMIYLPRGWGHAARTNDDLSIHITLGVHPINWAMTVLKAAEDIVASEPRFRESLPIAFARDDGRRRDAERRLTALLDDLRARMDAGSMVANAARDAQLGRQPALRGQLLDFVRARSLDEQTTLRRREQVEGRLSKSNGEVSLLFHGKSLTFPARVEPELSYMCESEGGFEPGSLPGDLDTEGRLTLTRRLVNEGFLTVEEPARSAQTPASNSRSS
ncbi:MAG: cupin domain-containing protein [Bryobacteraceae bacterium]